MKTPINLKFEFERNNYEASVNVTHNLEEFGNDADGNRGIPIMRIEEIIIHGVIDENATLVAPCDAMEHLINRLASDRIME